MTTARRISKRGLLTTVGLLASVLLIGVIWHGQTSARRVNILLITLDTTRADRLGCYGDADAQTPRFDALATQGTLFERAYATIPMTLPSHASMLTGLWPIEHGLLTNGQKSLATGIPTLPEKLSEHGYETAAFVAAFVLHNKFGLSRGFDHYDDDLSTARRGGDELHRFRDGRIVVDSTIDWLQQRARGDSKKPFFCWVHLYDPHDPYDPHADEFGESFHERPYDGEIAYVDQQVGRLLDAMSEAGELDNTYIMIVGDHGESLGEHGEETHGFMLHDSTIRVPLIVVDPRRPEPARRVAEPIPLIDVFATLISAGGASLPASSGSRSLEALCRGEPGEPRVCYTMTNEPYYQAFWSPLQSLTTDRWRYIRTTKPELYDLRDDPRELNNLVASQPELARQLESQLLAFEGTLQPGQGGAVKMTSQEQRGLESLGYAGGIQSGTPEVTKNSEAGEPLPDIKEMIGPLNELNHAVDLIDEGKFDEAAVALEPLARDVPNFFRARLNLGLCKLQAREYDAAIDWLKQALEIDPQSERAHDMLGFCYLRQKKLEEAMRHYLEVLRMRPDSETANLFLGEINQRRGNYILAKRYYETVLSINPGNRSARAALEAIVNTGVR